MTSHRASFVLLASFGVACLDLAVPAARSMRPMVLTAALDSEVRGFLADSITPSADGGGLSASWTRWARIGAAPTQWVEPGIRADVEWRLEGTSLIRTERLTAARPVRVRRWSVIVPATGHEWNTSSGAGMRRDTFTGREGRLSVSVPEAGWPYTVTVVATGDSASGRGARGPIPLHLRLDARDVMLVPGTPRAWTLALTTNTRLATD